MNTIKESIIINCPLEKISTYTTEATNWPIWQSIIVAAEPISSGPMGIGSTYKGIVRMMGLSMKWNAEVTEYEPGIRWTKNISSVGIQIAEQISYEDLGESVNFTIQYDIKASGIMKLFAPMMARTMRKETIKSLANLKEILEE